MSVLRRAFPLLFVALTCGAAAVHAQGLYWETTNTTPKGDQVAHFWAMPKMMKIAGDNGPVIILRSDEEKLVSYNADTKTYWEMPFTELEAMSKKVQAQLETAMEQIKSQMKDMPAEQRAMVEKMMAGHGQAKSAPVTVKKTKETKPCGTYACTKYVASQEGKPILVAWTTDDVAAFKPMRDDFVALQKRLNDSNRGSRTGLAEAYAKIEGFPMETEIGDIKSVVTKVEPRDIPASEFLPPAGFKKEDPPLPEKEPAQPPAKPEGPGGARKHP